MATATLDPTALNAAALAEATVPSPAKKAPGINDVHFTFYRADAASGDLANHLVAQLSFGELGSVTLDTNDKEMITADEAKALRSLSKRLYIAGIEKLKAAADEKLKAAASAA